MRTRSRTSRSLLVCLLALVALAATAGSATAKKFVVNRTGDHAPGKCTRADCTLREAAIAATAKPSDDRIKLPAKKYRLKRDIAPGPDAESGDVDFGVGIGPGNVTTLVHPGAGRATIDASAIDDRAIAVYGNLVLRRIKVTGGNAQTESQMGGGISGRGVVTVRDSVIAGNQAGDSGGGIAMERGIAIVKRSVIRRNFALGGGALYTSDQASAQVKASTIVRNTASRDGGAATIRTGLFFGSTRFESTTIARNTAGRDGGAIFTTTPNLLVSNSTVTLNEAGDRGGAIYSAPDSEARVNSASIVANRADSDDAGGETGGGIYADGGSDVVKLSNSLLAGNLIGSGTDVNECDAPAPVGIESLGGNLLTSTAAGCTFLDHPEDILAANPKLKALANNGGPTKTIALKAASPAVDEADGPNPPAVDQRGQARDDADIGAYER